MKRESSTTTLGLIAGTVTCTATVLLGSLSTILQVWCAMDRFVAIWE